MLTSLRVRSLFICLAGMVLLSSTALQAQVTTADVVGTVTDVTGAVLAGSKVTITDTGTGQVRTAQTNAGGDYTFSLLQPGTYALRWKCPTFRLSACRP